MTDHPRYSIPARAHVGDRSLAAAIRNHIVDVLYSVDGSRTAAARVLGVHRQTLQRMIRRWT